MLRRRCPYWKASIMGPADTTPRRFTTTCMESASNALEKVACGVPARILLSMHRKYAVHPCCSWIAPCTVPSVGSPLSLTPSPPSYPGIPAAVTGTRFQTALATGSKPTNRLPLHASSSFASAFSPALRGLQVEALPPPFAPSQRHAHLCPPAAASLPTLPGYCCLTS